MNCWKSTITAGMVILHLVAVPVEAQRADGKPPRSTVRLVTGGLLVGAAGLAAGGLAGVFVGANSCLDEGNPDSCRAAEGLVIGSVGGSALGIPLGVHLANDRAGLLAPSMLASAAIAVAGGIVFAQADDKVVLGAVVVSVPVLQIVSSVAIERATARRRRR